MTKKVVAVMFGCLLAMSLCACGETETDTDTTTREEQVVEGVGDIGDFHVEVKDASLATDSDGNPAIIISYSWTNNSDTTTNAMTEFAEQAFQDGVELDTAFIGDASVYDAESGWKDIRPGTTLENVQKAYVLTSDTSAVEFEISGFIVSADEVVSMTFDPASLN